MTQWLKLIKNYIFEELSLKPFKRYKNTACFDDVRIFPLSSIVFGDDITMASFPVTWFSNLHIL